ncbi:unnamed protein product [Mytilus edulis]|uniref:Transposase Tc1-like domain-containing protein n=1 Tax=Mytilus edulis TaxID=6550 RepID=A0A8S3TAJ0_MYTED|nr:unnamed protein product [Mytilus edulis]
MVRRRISEAQRWQIIGMRSSGLSYKAIGRQMGYHYTVVSRLVRKHIQTNNVKDLPRSGRPLVTSQREDRALQRLVRRMPFATSPVLKREWLPHRQLSTRTLRNRLKSAGLKSRRVIRRPMLTDRHQQLRLAWCLARRGVRDDGNEGDIALDDIKITNSYCEDLRSRCQLSYSDQCTMNSNEEPLFEFKEECTEINQPISLSCSNQYLTVDHDEFIFDPKFEFCHDIYMSSKSSLCNNTHDSEICTFNLHRIIQSYPECFSRYSMTIDYTCEEKPRNSRSQLNSEHSKLTGIAVGVSLGCGMVASIATLIILLTRRYNKNKNDNSINQQNNYIGNQGVAFPPKRQQNVDKIELIGEINVDHQYHDVKCTPPLPVTDDEYTYIDSMDNPANTCTIELGGQVDKTYTKVNPSNPSSKDSSKQNMAMRRQNDRCNIAYGTNDTIHDVRNGDNEYALIDPRDKSKGLVQTPGKLTIGSYVVSDPNETGFNRHLNMTIERDERSNKPAKCAMKIVCKTV